MAHIIFFDGVCNLCNSSIDFIINRDASRNFRYAPLQSTFAKKLLKENQVDTNSMTTMVLLKNDRLYFRSDAALEIARDLTFPWPVFYIFKIIPRFIRDWVYGLVSRNRYSWFGKRDTCRVPTAEEKSLFLEEVEKPSAATAKSQLPTSK